jgi:hypothetical protein
VKRVSRIFAKRFWIYIINMWTIANMFGLLSYYVFNKFHVQINDYGIKFEDIHIARLPWWAFREELIFRFLPFLLILLSKYQFSIRQTWSIMVVVSCIFGYMHGAVVAIFVQGVMGLYFAWIFWRYSFRLKNFKSLMVGLVASTTVHFSYNLFVVVIQKIL